MYKEKAEVKCTDYQYPDLSIYIYGSALMPPTVSHVSYSLKLVIKTNQLIKYSLHSNLNNFH